MDELDEIYRFIQQSFPGRAKSFLKALQNKILSLKKFPHRGSRAKILEEQEEGYEVRFIEYKHYLIFYTVDEKKVNILHLAGPGENWVKWFV